MTQDIRGDIFLRVDPVFKFPKSLPFVDSPFQKFSPGGDVRDLNSVSSGAPGLDVSTTPESSAVPSARSIYAAQLRNGGDVAYTKPPLSANENGSFPIMPIVLFGLVAFWFWQKG